MSIFQTNINTIVASLYAKGLRHVIICPGSRNAPLIMAFNRYGKIHCISAADERSAAFMALGMSKQLQMPVAIVCTSGSAVLNCYPAIAEAFYMQVPLLVITADRPAEMLDRWDGQTIHQYEVFKSHVLGSFQTPENMEEDLTHEISAITNLYYEKSNQLVKGPVHLNVPLKEPLYQAAQSTFIYPEITEANTLFSEKKEWDLAIEEEQFLINFPKVMILHGADAPSDIDKKLNIFWENNFVVVLSDVISNKHSIGNIKNWEGVLLNINEEQQKELVPDLLITTGKMVLNKSLKILFRKHKPSQHWHIAESGFNADTFFTNPEVITLNPLLFFEKFMPLLPKVSSSYFKYFKSMADKHKAISEQIVSKDFNAFDALKIILKRLPENITLHLANSMSVRYVAYLNDYLKDNWKIYSNRGVSGIDGCTSTAIGAAMVDETIHILITGDIAFFYDINALWQQYMPTNFKIVLLNDFGGGIFKNIDGPNQMPELNPYLFTPHKMNAKLMAEHFKLDYWLCKSNDDLNDALPEWMLSNKPSIFEIQTDSEINSLIFNTYKHQLL